MLGTYYTCPNLENWLYVSFAFLCYYYFHDRSKYKSIEYKYDFSWKFQEIAIERQLQINNK